MQVTPPLQVIEAHKGGIWSLCASPSGLIVSAGDDGLLKSWKVETHTGGFLPLAEAVTPHTEVLLIHQSPHGVLVSAGHEGGIATWEWDSASGGLAQRQQLILSDERRHYNDRLLETHSGYLVAWASGTAGRPAVCQWSDTERAFNFLHELPIERASTFMEMPDGALLSGDERGQICCWRLEAPPGSWDKVAVLQAHDGPIHALAWTRGGALISAGGNEPLLKLWRKTRGGEGWELAQVLAEHRSQILEVLECGSAALLSSDRGERSLLGWRHRPELLVWSMAPEGLHLVQRQTGRLRGYFEGDLLLEDDGVSALSLWRKAEETYERIAVLDGIRRGGMNTFVLLADGTLVAGGLDGRLVSWHLGSHSRQRASNGKSHDRTP